MNPEMFRKYDIRGVAGEDMTDDDVVLIGKAVGTFLRQFGCSILSVGRDCRMTSKLYSQKVIEAFEQAKLTTLILALFLNHPFGGDRSQSTSVL